MRRVFAFFTILGAIPVLLRLVFNGVISLQFAGIVIGVLLLSLAMGNRILRVVLPIFAVAILATEYTKGDPSQFAGALTMLVALAMALYGIYLMLSGLFRPRQ
jgi:hypothetical protein